MDLNHRFFKTNSVEKNRENLDEEVLEWLEPYAEKLDIPVEEVIMNLHEQDIYVFDDLDELLGTGEE